MVKQLFIVFRMIKRNIIRFLILFVVLCVAFYTLIYVTAVENSFRIYTNAYQSTWGNRLCYEFTAFDSKKDAETIEKDLSAFSGVSSVCEVYYLYTSVDYENLPVTFLFIGDSFWENCSLVKMEKDYSESGMIEGNPEVITCDPYGLLPSGDFELQSNDINFTVHTIGEFQEPYLFPNLYLSGTGISVFDRFISGETAIVMKLSDDTLEWSSNIGIGRYSDMGFVFLDSAACEDEINSLKEYGLDNSIELEPVEWTEENQTELKENYLNSYFQLGLFLLCVLLMLLITYLVVFFKENMKEFTIMRIVAGSARQCRQIARLLAVLPLLFADVFGWSIFIILSRAGKIPFFTAPSYMFSAGYLFAAIFAVNVLYCVLTVVILSGIYRNSDIGEQKRRVFI